jgi:hypothetical protein
MLTKNFELNERYKGVSRGVAKLVASLMKSEPGPPMTLGAAAAAKVF